jgi:Skp family chaperone for outer membrane proteins
MKFVRKAGLTATVGFGFMSLMAIGLMANVASAQNAPTGGAATAGTVTGVPAIGMGVIDEDRLAEGYTSYRAAAAQLDKQAEEVDNQLAARELMNETEGKTFDELALKPKRTPEENTRLAALIKSGNDRRTEYMGLLPIAQKTEQQNARIKVLEDLARSNAAKSRTISDQLYNDIKRQQEETDKNYTDRANNVIAQVAAEKKFVMIVRQRAIVWSNPANDITGEVLSRLNKPQP